MNKNITKLEYINDSIEDINPNVLQNSENYGIFSDIIVSNNENIILKNISIKTSDITKENWLKTYTSLLNVLKDGIESKELHSVFIDVFFEDGINLDLSIPDLLINLIMWNMLIRTNVKIESKHVFFAEEIKKDTIKDYIDKFFIDNNRKLFSNKELNNIIDDTLYRFHDIDGFALYLSNTVNLEDNVLLMDRCPEFYECMHADLRNTPIEDVKSVGMQYANKAIDIMKNAKQYLGYDHCLADACRASEGINPKQFKEFTINIGTKPDGRGGTFPVPIYNSFINGGVATPLDYFIESSTGRTAQIIKYKNVGHSGHFARLLGLNNMDSYLNNDPNFDCCSQNFITITIKDKKTLKMLRNRYYRFHRNGVEKLISIKDIDLIGKTIMLRSPVTCASAARGQGVCYKCYGDLAYTVYDAGVNFGVNIGRIASETLSSSLTQKLLSAKHLLETSIERVTWVKKFNEFFEIEGNVVKLIDEEDFKDCKFILDPESIELVNEEDDDLTYDDDDDGNNSIYNEYIVEFDILQNGEFYHISNDKNAKLYISNELNTVIRKKAEPMDDKISINLSDMKDMPLFIMPIENNELSKTLDHLNDLLDTNKAIKGLDLNQMLQALLDTVIEGGMNIAATHIEVILSNQVRDANDILKKPKWYLFDPDYEILSLNKSLTNNPSVTVSMSYQKVSKMLYNPLTFRKRGSSFMDLFFMERPQFAIKGIDEPKDEEFKPTPGEIYEPMIFFEDPDKVTVSPEIKDLDTVDE